MQLVKNKKLLDVTLYKNVYFIIIKKYYISSLPKNIIYKNYKKIFLY